MTAKAPTPYANSLFEQPWWLDIVAPGQWDEVIVKEGEEIVGRLPFVLKGKDIGMPPLTQTLGPWITPKYRVKKAGNSQLSDQKEIIGELLAQLPKHSNFSLYLDSANEYLLPYRWLGYRYEPSFSYRITDLGDVDGVYKRFHKTVKRHIKRAEQQVTVVNRTEPRLMMDLMEKNFSEQGRTYPYPYSLIERIVTLTTEGNHGKMFLAEDDAGRAQVCSFIVYDETSCYDLLGASDASARSSGAHFLVTKEEIAFAAQNSRYFDFEGSNIEAIENFIRQFGGDRVTNYHVTKQSLLRDLGDLMKPRVKRLIGYKN